MIETSEPAPELRLFTVELAYTVLSCATVKVEAVSFEDACAKALADPPWEDFDDNSESTGEPYVLQIGDGDIDLCEDPNALANVPIAYADEADQLRAERDEMLPALRRLVAMIESNWSDDEVAETANDAEALDAARTILRAFPGEAANPQAAIGANASAPAADPITAGWEKWSGSTTPHAEGWLISNNSAGSDEIQRDDEAETFETDEDALAFVRQRAGEGSELHAWALAVHEHALAEAEEDAA